MLSTLITLYGLLKKQWLHIMSCPSSWICRANLNIFCMRIIRLMKSDSCLMYQLMTFYFNGELLLQLGRLSRLVCSKKISCTTTYVFVPQA